MLYNSTCLRKALLKVPCALVVSQKRRNTSYLIAKTITKSVTELCLIFSTFQLNPCSSETPDSQRKKIQTFLKLFINSLLRQGALTINFAQAFVAALLRSSSPRGFVSGGLKLGTFIHLSFCSHVLLTLHCLASLLDSNLSIAVRIRLFLSFFFLSLRINI